VIPCAKFDTKDSTVNEWFGGAVEDADAMDPKPYYLRG
jgi:hypothetical protein